MKKKIMDKPLYRMVEKALQKGFVHIMGGSILNRIIAFLGSVAVVRVLSKEEYGVFSCAWNIFGIIMIANGFGMDAGVLQLCSERSDDEAYVRRTVHCAAATGAAFNILLGAVILAVGLSVPLAIDGAGSILMLLCALPVFRFMFDLMAASLRARRENRRFALLSIANALLVFGFGPVFAYFFGAQGMAAGYYAGYAGTILLGVVWLRIPLLRHEGRLVPKERRQLFRISAVSMCNNGLSRLLLLMDVFMIGLMAKDEAMVAGYRVAGMIPSALTFIPMAVITCAYPYFAGNRADNSRCLHWYRKILLGLGGFNAAVSLFLCLLAPWIVDRLFGPAYRDVAPVFRLLSLNYFIAGTFRTPAGNLLVTQRRLKFNFFVSLAAGAVNIAADALLIPVWGMMGAAAATMMAVVLSAALSTGYLLHILSGRKKDHHTKE